MRRSAKNIIIFIVLSMARNFWSSIRQFFWKLNLFESESDDVHVIACEQLSTRIYIIIMFMLLFTASIVALCISHSTLGYVSMPSQTIFEQLVQSHSLTLKCPCSQLSVVYETFSTVKVRFHQVCSSHFVSQQWIDSVYTNSNDSIPLVPNDPRPTMSAFWQIVAGLCQLSNMSVNYAVAQFHATSLLVPLALSADTVRTESQVTYNTLMAVTQSTFLRSLLTIEGMIASNQLVSGLQTNFYARFGGVDQPLRPVFAPRMYENCSCLSLHGCPRPATDRNMNPIPGIILDCLMMDATLESSLECYYNRSCISSLHPSMSLIEALKTSNETQSKATWTLGELVEISMVEEVAVTIAFDRFYRQCKPTYCSYVYSRSFDIIFAGTTVIGLYGGLALILSVLVPFIAKRMIEWRQRRALHSRPLVLPTADESK